MQLNISFKEENEQLINKQFKVYVCERHLGNLCRKQGSPNFVYEELTYLNNELYTAGTCLEEAKAFIINMYKLAGPTRKKRVEREAI